MVLSAADALTLTTNFVSTNNSLDLQTEVSLAEDRIRQATSLGLSEITYDATIIGNPQLDPRATSDLPQLQLDFFNVFSTASYVVGLDTASGRWFFSWSPSGAETQVSIYSFRTSFDPTAIVNTTTTVIQAYFESIRPIMHSTVSYNGFIDEAGFGGTTSTYWEFTIIVDQTEDLTNHAVNLKASIVAQGLGYTTNNCNVYQLVA